MVKIGLFGLGTVGSGVAQILHDSANQIQQEYDQTPIIKQVVVRNVEKYRQQLPDWADFGLSNQPDDILTDPEIDVVIETMGTIDAAEAIIRQALEADKSVITANKDLMALRGPALIKLAQEHGQALYYEAAVAGGIPILNTLSTSFAADQVTGVAGIINGTSNFILTQMTDLANMDFSYERALKLAQEKGFAESDPTNDVDGLDAAYKLMILADFAFGVQPKMDQVSLTGIRQVTNEQMKEIHLISQLPGLKSSKSGYQLKLLGLARLVEGQNAISLEVAPYLVSQELSLAAIRNENNAVLIESRFGDQTTLAGPGAGQLPTANAVVADLMRYLDYRNTPLLGKPFNRKRSDLGVVTAGEYAQVARFLTFELANNDVNRQQLLTALADNQIELVGQDEILNSSDQVLRFYVHTQPITATQVGALKAELETHLQIQLKSEYKIFNA
ncbi:homoserine dehydrogenase [Lactobacillaceae bacterium L1_55_11]|nr:homoserine dehydrogenase [Lactobacillaceae bacterium L1_55_11]